MTVLSTTSLSRPGNDCYIYESVSLVEQFGLYAVIRFYKVTGWSEREKVTVLLVTRVHAEAGNKYKEYCKYYKT